MSIFRIAALSGFSATVQKALSPVQAPPGAEQIVPALVMPADARYSDHPENAIPLGPWSRLDRGNPVTRGW